MLGFLLIVLGGFLLLTRFGYVDWIQLVDLLRFWPLVLIAFGVSLLLPRGSWVFTGLLAVLILAGLAYAFATPNPGMGGWETTELVAGPVLGATTGLESVETQLTFAAGELHVTAGAQHVAELKARHGARLKEPDLRFNELGDRRSRVELLFPGRTNWTNFIGIHDRHYRAELLLNERVRHDLRIEFAAGAGALDLKGLTVRAVDIDMAAGQLVLELGLPQHDNVELTTVNFNMAAGQLRLDVPAETGVRADIEVVAGSTNLSELGWENRDGVYFSPNYDSAEHRVEVSGTVVAGELRLRQR